MPASAESEARKQVHALLSAAGIAPTEPEIEAMSLGFPMLRAAADALYCEAIAAHAPAFLPTDDEVGR